MVGLAPIGLLTLYLPIDEQARHRGHLLHRLEAARHELKAGSRWQCQHIRHRTT
jgi:hypothetical protein